MTKNLLNSQDIDATPFPELHDQCELLLFLSLF